MNRSSTALITLVIAASLLHLSILTLGFTTLAKNGFLYDDAFYAFQVARSIADGAGATFDGIHPTNGFQPLYVLLLVPVYLLTGSSPVVPVYVALTLLAILTSLTAVFLFKILERYVSPAVALLCAGVWVFSPVVLRQSLNGLETSLALFLLAASSYYYITRIRSRRDPSTAAFVRLGFLLGLCVLARVDQAFLALAMVLDYLLLLRSRGHSREGLSKVFAAGGVAVAVYLPWMIYGWYAVGTPFQESGAATRFLSLAYAPFFGVGSHDMSVGGPDTQFIWAHLVRSLTVLKLTPAVHVFFRAFEKFGGSLSPGIAVVAANAIGLTLLGGVIFWLTGKMRRGGDEGVREMRFLLWYSGMLIAAYTFYEYGVFFFVRYLYPLYFVAMVIVGFVVSDVVTSLRRRPLLIRRLAMAAGAVYVSGLLYMTYNSGFRSIATYPFYDVARWAADHTSEDEVIGSFQSGAIGYLSGRKVVNLDGKVNSQALAALRSGDLATYVAVSGIDVILDHSKVISLFLGPWSDEDYLRVARESELDGSSLGAPGWVSYVPASVTSHRGRARSAFSPAMSRPPW